MKMAVIYWSGTGNTEEMANIVANKAKEKGCEVDLKKVSQASPSDIADCDFIALGCPSMGDEVLEEWEMEPFVDAVSGEVKGKKVLLFGSYGWGDGKWMRDWEERMVGYGASVAAEPVIANGAPGDPAKKKLEDMVEAIVK